VSECYIKNVDRLDKLKMGLYGAVADGSRQL